MNRKWLVAVVAFAVVGGIGYLAPGVLYPIEHGYDDGPLSVLGPTVTFGIAEAGETFTVSLAAPCMTVDQQAELTSVSIESIDSGISQIGIGIRQHDWETEGGGTGWVTGYPPNRDDVEPVEGYVIDISCGANPEFTEELFGGFQKLDERGGAIQSLAIEYDVGFRSYIARAEMLVTFCGEAVSDEDCE